MLVLQVIAYTILEYKKRRDNYLKDRPQKGRQNLIFPLLLEAWRPVSMAFKKRYNTQNPGYLTLSENTFLTLDRENFHIFPLSS